MADRTPKTSAIIKKITVYTNGEASVPGIKVLINQQVPTLESLFATLNSKIKTPYGVVWKLYTMMGINVSELDQLQHGEAYVAAGYEHFKQLDYCEKTAKPKKKKEEALTGPKKFSSQFCTIKVFTNGEDLVPAVPVKVPKYAMRRMETVLSIVAEKLHLRTGVNRLYTLDGHPVEEPMELKSHEHYVAVGRGTFKPVSYVQKVTTSCKKSSGSECTDSSSAVQKADCDTILDLIEVFFGKNVPKSRKAEFCSINVYANGKALVPPVHINIPKYVLKELEDVITMVASKMCLDSGVKRLYTLDGHPIEDPMDLKNNERYVAVGHGIFKPAPYGQSPKATKNSKNERKDTATADKKPQPLYTTTVIKKDERRKNINAGFCSINVFANGKALMTPVHIKIPPYALKRLEDVNNMVAEKMHIGTGVSRLCTLDGHPIDDPMELKSHKYYVAVGRGPFKPVPYGQIPVSWMNSTNERQDTSPDGEAVHHAQDMIPQQRTVFVFCSNPRRNLKKKEVKPTLRSMMANFFRERGDNIIMPMSPEPADTDSESDDEDL